MPRHPVVQQPSTYERVRRRSNALLLSLDPRPTLQHTQEATGHGLPRVTVCEVTPDGEDSLPQDVYSTVALTPPPRSPTSGALIMPPPPGSWGTPPSDHKPALRQMPLPPEPDCCTTPALARTPMTSRHFGLDVGPNTTQHLQACAGYLNAWLHSSLPPEAMTEHIKELRRGAEALAQGEDDVVVLYNAMFRMMLEHNRLLSVGRHAVLEQAQGAPATAGLAPAAQWHTMTEAFMRRVDTISAALEVFLNLAESCVIMARALGAYTQRTGVWAPDPKSGHAPPLFVALHACHRQLLHNLRRISQDLRGWSEIIATQERLMGCSPPEDIAPYTVFASLRHLQPFSIDVLLQLPFDALHFSHQIEAATQLRHYLHFVGECLETALTYIEAGWDTHVAREPALL